MHNHCDRFGWHRHRHEFAGRHYRGFRHFSQRMGGGPGRDWGDFSAGRKIASGDLQLLILVLLAEKPRHGYEIIKALDERSGGFYIPSPGMVYPALTYLEEIGHATVESAGARKLYHITDAGRAHLEENREVADAMLEQLQHLTRKMEHLRHFFTRGEEADDEEFSADKDVQRARYELKSALHEARHAPADERKRIAEILRGAAAQIRKAPPGEPRDG